MKRFIKVLLALIMVLAMMVCVTACGGSSNEEPADTEETETTETAEDTPEEEITVVKTIEDIDEDIGMREPLQIESITLYDDGTVAIVPLDELKKNEIKDDATAV